MTNKEYNVGDQVWWATCEQQLKTEKCPVCYGKCVVTVILGNDEHVQVPCDYCGKGFDGPRGYVEEKYERVSGAKQIVLTGKEVMETAEGRQIEYRYGCYVLRTDDVFETREEADARVQEKITKFEEEDSQRRFWKKDNTTKSFAWHVGYHKREAARAKRDWEYHEEKAKTMKDKAKAPPIPLSSAQ